LGICAAGDGARRKSRTAAADRPPVSVGNKAM
jgi:hypothetical protein